MFKFSLIERLKLVFNFGRRKSESGKGGDAGEVFIAARKIVGEGPGGITADGGDGTVGGKGGKVTIISEDYQYKGEISAKGGKSFLSSRWYQKWFGLLIIGIVGSAVVALVFYFL